MECPVSISDLFNTNGELPDGWSELSVSLNDTINSLEQSLLSSNLKELCLDAKNDYLFTRDRDAVIEKTKLSVINETLNSLKLLYNLFERWYIAEESSEFYRRIDMKNGLILRLRQILNNLVDTFDSLNINAKSPYDMETILDPDYFKQSLKTHPTDDLYDRANSLIKLAQNELVIIKESCKTNEMQKVILTLYLEKLKAFDDQVTCPPLLTTNSESKKRSKSADSNKINKICAIMKKCQRLIKDVYEFMEISTFKDYFNESDEIFNVINEKGPDAIPDLLQYIESKKTKWIESDSENITRATCRSGVLRRLNIILKLLKKLNLLRDQLEPSFIILAIKNMATVTLEVQGTFSAVYWGAYHLTFKGLPKPRVDVPPNFARADPIYEEINKAPCHGFLIIYIHFLEYFKYLQSLDWNYFQHRKPWEVTDYLYDIERLINGALNVSLNQDETHKISLDLADRYLMTKQKIHYDRETLAFRFGLFKPQKLYQFRDVTKILYSQRDSYRKRNILRDLLKDKFDGLIGQLNRKVTNRGQLIVFERSMAMMKRSIYLYRIIRSDLMPKKDAHFYDKLIDQAVNEYFYAYETVVKLLDLLRPNRRITFSFSANGLFTTKIDSIGLKVKDELLETINSQIKTLKIQIMDKEADLESVKNEKTQLKYLQSISKRIKLIPINELEMTDEDNIAILREIIEEYEFTNIQYGSVKIL